MTFALQARGIRKSFGGVEVVHGVDLDAVGGSVLALLGENGAGKSTLVKIIAGDYTPDTGEIIVGDASYASLTPISARDLGVAIIFQEAGCISVVLISMLAPMRKAQTPRHGDRGQPSTFGRRLSVKSNNRSPSESRSYLIRRFALWLRRQECRRPLYALATSMESTFNHTSGTAL